MTDLALSIKNLNKTYSNGVVALKNINLEVNSGDFFALLGPNGAGKSTLIGILASLINKTTGKVHMMGFDIDTNFSQAKSKIGLVPQEFNFNNFEPLFEIIKNQAGYYGFNRAEAADSANDCLDQLGLWEKRKHIARELSGGMKRRLMIARALVHNPELLILDEPTAGVDIEIRRSMWDLLKEINSQGKTIILTTHYLEEAERLCRNISIIDGGKIIVDTSMRDLLEKLTEESFILYLQENLPTNFSLPEFQLVVLDDKTIEVSLTSEQTLLNLFNHLNEKAISVISIKNKSNRLEELFIKLTSQKSN